MTAASATIFEQCAIQSEGNQTSILQCVIGSIEDRNKQQKANVEQWLLVLAASMVFFMQAGFAMLCAGCVRKKNVMNTMLKNFLDACGSAVAFYSIGFAFAFGDDPDTANVTFLGFKNFFMTGNVDQAFWFFQYAVSATATTIVAGTLAERCQMSAYLCYSVVLTGFVYPFVAHHMWSPNGLLSPSVAEPFNGIGVIDLAGSGVVHITGGATACIATYMLGARTGRFYDSRGRAYDKPRQIPGHSIALQVMGTMVLWFGWHGFNAGSVIQLNPGSNQGRIGALAAANTSLAAAAGATTALFCNLYIHERQTGEYTFDLTRTLNACLSGLVAVTAGCGTVENWAAVLTGAIAGILYLGGSWLIVWLKLDDAVDAIPVHLFSGIWGLIATGLFSSPRLMLATHGTDKYAGFFYEIGRGSLDTTLFGNQLLGICFILTWVTLTMLPFFWWLNYMGWLRSDSLEELVGLDLSYNMGSKANSALGSNDDSNGEDQTRNGDDVSFNNDAGMKRNHRSFTNQDDLDAASTQVQAKSKSENV